MLGRDFCLESLLGLNGYIFTYKDDYTIKITAKQMPLSAQYPLGLKYSMVLLDRDGTRIYGIDNKVHNDKHKAARDHKHILGDRIQPYNFTDVGQLFSDFYDGADKTIKAIERQYEHES